MNQSTSFYQIKDFAKVKGGKRLPQGFLVQDIKTDHPYIRVTDMRNDGLNVSDIKYLPEGVYEKISKYTISNDDIYISNAGTVGLTGKIPDYLSGANLTENSAKVTELDTDLINQDYLIYFLRSREGQFQIKSRVGGSSQPKLALNKIETIEVPRLPISQQSQIATILSNYDDLIVNNEKRIKILEEMAQRLYTEWFVKFKFPGHEKVKMVDSGTAFGMIPEGWEVKKLGDVASETRKQVDPTTLDPSTPYVGLEHIPRKTIVLSDWGKANEVKSSKLLFRTGDILFGKIRPYFHKVVTAPIDGITSSDTIVIEAKEDKHEALVLMCTSSENFVSYSTTTSQGTKMPRADWKNLVKFPVCIPKGNIILSFNTYIQNLVSEMNLLMLNNRKLRSMSDLLIPQLVSGKRKLKQ